MQTIKLHNLDIAKYKGHNLRNCKSNAANNKKLSFIMYNLKIAVLSTSQTNTLCLSSLNSSGGQVLNDKLLFKAKNNCNQKRFLTQLIY